MFLNVFVDTAFVINCVREPSRNILVRIRRQDHPAAKPRWEEFNVVAQSHMNVIACLQQIAVNPVTAQGVRTSPPAWDCGCLEERCGGCTMLINGQIRQACSALVDRIASPGEPISIEPLSKFPVVRDLVVDRSRIFNDLKRIKAWVPVDTCEEGPGPLMSPQLQQRLYKLSRCTTCGACLEACPQYKLDNTFVGAAVMSQAALFNQHPVGAQLRTQRLDVLLSKGGVADCDTKGNCGIVCPTGVPHATAIDYLARDATRYGLERLKRPARKKQISPCRG